MDRSVGILLVSLGLFVTTLGVGFLSDVPNLFLLPLAGFAGCGVLLARHAARMDTSVSERRHVRAAGLGSVSFCMFVFYGVLGIWGYFDIIDWLYVGGTIVSAVIYLFSLAAGIRALLRGR